MKRRTFLILIALCVVVLSACLLFACSNKSEQQTINNTDETASQTTYTIHFNLNGGRSNSNIRTKQVTRLSANDFFFNVEKSGYIFRGWSYNGRIVFDENGDFVNWVNITDGMTFVAEWDNKAKLDISTNMPEAGTVTKNGKYDFYSYVDVSATVNQGYVFVGWYNEDGIPLSNQLTYRYQMGNKDIELLAIYKLDSFTLHIQSNNGYKGTVTINPPNKSGATITYYEDTDESIEYKESVTIAAYTKTDSRFLGWFDAAGRLVSADAVYSFKMPNHYYYLMAKWDYFTITYDLDGGINNENNPTSYTLSTPTIHLEDPTKGQEYFVGWKLGNKYVSEIDTKMKENITLTAIWQSYTLTTDTNLEGAGTFTGSRTILPGNSATITTETNPGYTWLGWYDGDTLLTTELSYTFTMPKDSVEYTAKWTYYTLSTETNIEGAGTYTLYNDTKVTAGSNVTLTAETNPGYTWIGWYDGDTLLTNELSYTFTMPKDSLNYIAKWIVCPVIIEKNINEAGIVSGLDGRKIGEIETITAETNLGYTWLGWYDSETCLTNEVSYSFVMSSNSVVYQAKWAVLDEMSNFEFASTTTTCQIASIKDKTVAEIVVPDYVTSISQGAFYECSSLESITIPFVGNSRKTSYPFGYIFGTSSYTGGTAVSQQYYESYLIARTYYIPSTLLSVTVTGENILYGAFYNCSMLASLTISDSVTSIGDRAFYGCTGLESIIGNSGNTSTVAKQSNPASFTVTIMTGESIGNSAFYGCSGMTAITIPDSVTSIGNSAFYGCSGLTSIIIPDNVTTIGENAFRECSGFMSITIGSSVINIGDNAFRSQTGHWGVRIYYQGDIAGWCGINGLDNSYLVSSSTFVYVNDIKLSEMTSIIIPDGVTSISSLAFYCCTGLTSVTIPDGVTSIGSQAFAGCTSLTTINYKGDIAGWCSISGLGNLMPNGSSTKSLYIDGVMVDGDLVIPSGVTGIGDYAFYNRSDLTSITIPDSVTNIGDYAFCNCSGVTSIDIPDSVTSIGNGAFINCTDLTSITIGNGVTSIGRDTFRNCSGLTAITFGGIKFRWTIISKGENWNQSTGNYTIHCTDGDIAKS